eukprot:10345776-Alexandrium_andersonii.AAC.1
MSASLVGSEMCIRDRYASVGIAARWWGKQRRLRKGMDTKKKNQKLRMNCLLYTSDAADDA